MRFLIVLDARSGIPATRVWDILNSHCARSEFEVLEMSVFHSRNETVPSLLEKAKRVAAQMLADCADADFCVVAYRERRPIVPASIHKAAFHRALALRRCDPVSTNVVLNDRISKPRIVSSPRLQPEIVHALMEYTIIDLAHKY